MKTLVELESVFNALTTEKARIDSELKRMENIAIGNDAANYVTRLKDERRKVYGAWRKANTELNHAKKRASHERRND